MKTWAFLVLLLLLILGGGWYLLGGGQGMGFTPYRYILIEKQQTDEGELWVVGYYPASERVIVIKVPLGLTIEAANGLGRYRISSLLDLGKQENLGNELLRQSVMQTLGLTIADVILTEKPLNERNGLDLGHLFINNPSLWWKLRRIKMGEYEWVDLDKKGLEEQIADVDGSMITLVNESNIDRVVNQIQGILVASEAPITVTIENTTERVGYAAQTRRFLTNDGFYVVGTGVGKGVLPYTIVVVAKPEKLAQVKAGLRWLFPEAEYRVDINNDYRSEVVIRLGQRN